jgi:AraC family transcriptional regulator of arabinose operon
MLPSGGRQKGCVVSSKAADARVKEALAMMQANERLEIGAIADVLNLSVSRFRHLFKIETGISVKRYQTRLRMARARELLEHSFLRVKEITVIVGISDVSHFTRNYKARYAQTPSQTRALSKHGQAAPQQTAISANK